MKPYVLLTCLLSIVLAAGCKRHEMYTQDKAGNWDSSIFFRDKSTMRPEVAGAVPRETPDGEEAQPVSITMAMLQRGRQRYEIFCAPCHGSAGDGLGMIVQRGFPMPPAFSSAEAEHDNAASLYAVIGRGRGAMYGFADRVPSSDRWAMVAYIRALQQSQDAAPASLPAEDMAKLAALP